MDFFNDIFHNLALLEFYFLNIIYILLYIEFILSIFFQHSNILTRASHHWCLASNIVLVPYVSPRWCHQMETSSALLALCVGNSPVTDEFPSQRPVTRSLDVFFDLRLNKRLSKQWWGWWFDLTVCWGADQRKHHQWPVDSHHKQSVTRKMFWWRHHAPS